MRGRYPMSEQGEHKITDTPAPAAKHARASLADLLAFLGVLVLAGGLAFLLDRTGQLSARLAFAGAAGLVAACVNAWRRLRRCRTAPLAQRPGHLPRPAAWPWCTPGAWKARSLRRSSRPPRRTAPHRRGRSACSRRTRSPCALAMASSITPATPGERRRSCTNPRPR